MLPTNQLKELSILRTRLIKYEDRAAEYIHVPLVVSQNLFAIKRRIKQLEDKLNKP